MEKGVRHTSFTTGRLLGVLMTALASWLFIGPAAAFALRSLIPSQSRAAGYIILHVPYVMLFLSLVLSVRLVLGVTLCSFISFNGPLRYQFLIQSALAYLFLLIATSFLSRSTVRPSGVSLGAWLRFLPLVIVLTPIQALSEEVVFRVFPARFAFKDGLPERIQEMIPLSILSGLLFLVPHLPNTEIEVSRHPFLTISYYFIWGMLAMFLALSTGGFEAPIAMHIVNNAYIALAVNYEGSSMVTDALFMNSELPSPSLNLLLSVITFLALFLLSWGKGLIVWRHHG